MEGEGNGTETRVRVSWGEVVLTSRFYAKLTKLFAEIR